jgi:2-polyprenyl-3-methyl-5-hydroxy-6-metoxy-1,4-benzoquinol methylase
MIVQTRELNFEKPQPILREKGNVSGGRCRFCGAELTESFIDLGMSPPCNKMVKPEQVNEMERFYPLNTFVCSECFLVQVQEYVSASLIFDDEYTYFSSFSTSWLEHSRKYVEMIIPRFGLTQESQVIELASNDGYLLQYFVQQGIPVLGIEPSANVAQAAIAKGIPSLIKFFGCQTATELVEDGKAADLIIGNNVLAHVPNINDFVGGVKIALKPSGVVTMEFPHLMRLMEDNQFDTIYHEHFSYLSFTTVSHIFAAHGLTLFDVEEISTHGGSLRIYGKHTEDSSKLMSERALDLLAREHDYGLDRMETYQDFANRCQEVRYELLEFLIDARRQGKQVAGYGAPGKGNTLLNYCGIRSDLLAYTVDRNPYKQGKFLPGTHIPVYTPEKIDETKPDYLLILPWNLKHEVMHQMAHVREWGCKFVIPIPYPQVLD